MLFHGGWGCPPHGADTGHSIHQAGPQPAPAQSLSCSTILSPESHRKGRGAQTTALLWQPDGRPQPRRGQGLNLTGLHWRGRGM